MISERVKQNYSDFSYDVSVNFEAFYLRCKVFLVVVVVFVVVLFAEAPSRLSPNGRYTFSTPRIQGGKRNATSLRSSKLTLVSRLATKPNGP